MCRNFGDRIFDIRNFLLSENLTVMVMRGHLTPRGNYNIMVESVFNNKNRKSKTLHPVFECKGNLAKV